MASLMNDDKGRSIDRNKAIGYLVAKAMAAQMFGNKERCKAFTEAAQIIRMMPQDSSQSKSFESARNVRK